MMTREEAISIIERVIHTEAKWPGTEDTLEALDMALSALRPVSQEQVEKVWSGCYMCDEYRYFMFNAWKDPNSSKRPDCMGTSMFCPNCGRPLTNEAVQMVMERLEALKDAD